MLVDSCFCYIELNGCLFLVDSIFLRFDSIFYVSIRFFTVRFDILRFDSIFYCSIRFFIVTVNDSLDVWIDFVNGGVCD